MVELTHETGERSPLQGEIIFRVAKSPENGRKLSKAAKVCLLLFSYKEAKIVQAKVREWEKKEAKEWEKAKKEKVASEMKLLKIKQENEIKVLNKKL